MPSRWEVQLTSKGDPAVTPVGAAIPVAAPQAVVSGWLDDPQPRRALSLPAGKVKSGHGDQARKWACGPLRTLADTTPGAAAVTLRLQVRLLDDNLADRLRSATRCASQVRLGQHHYEISSPARLVEEASWRELRCWAGARAWQLRFVTPACFRRGTRTSPWPAPESVWRSAADRWRQLDPDTAPPVPRPGSRPVWISDIDGSSDVCVLTRNVRRNGSWLLEDEMISGFAGRIRYVCDDGTDDEAAAFGAALAFAAFGGAGSHTTYGFGVVLPEPTWQPPTVRRGR